MKYVNNVLCKNKNNFKFEQEKDSKHTYVLEHFILLPEEITTS